LCPVHIVRVGLENDGIRVSLSVNIVNGKVPAAFNPVGFFYIECCAQVKAVIWGQPLTVPVTISIYR
jgi:hypothetical protein